MAYSEKSADPEQAMWLYLSISHSRARDRPQLRYLPLWLLDLTEIIMRLSLSIWEGGLSRTRVSHVPFSPADN